MRNYGLIILIFFITGCATTKQPADIRSVPARQEHIGLGTEPLSRPYSKGIYHEVLAGQTLWQIAKAYRVDINDIVEVNHISNSSKIDKGQLIFIPSAKESLKGELTAHPSARSESSYIWPLKGPVLSYYNSKRDNVANKGIDIGAQEGQAVVASRSGKVVFCDDKVKGMGKAIIIEHDDGYSTLYAHNSEHLVACGDFVKQNQPIAKAGSTGRADRPMLHFQVRKGHEPRDPFYYLP